MNRRLLGSSLLITILVIILSANLVMAESTYQEEVPTETPTVTATATITPTPRIRSEIPLTTGDKLVIERSISYGDIAITIAISSLVLVNLLAFLISWERKWLR